MIIHSLILILYLKWLFMHQPFILRLILVSIRIVLGLNAGILISDWIMVVLIITYASGIGVMFIYISSLGHVQKSFFISKTEIIILFTIFFISFTRKRSTRSYRNSENQFLYFKLNWILVFLSFYLLILLLRAVKLSESFKGSLQKIF